MQIHQQRAPASPGANETHSYLEHLVPDGTRNCGRSCKLLGSARSYNFGIKCMERTGASSFKVHMCLRCPFFGVEERTVCLAVEDLRFTHALQCTPLSLYENGIVCVLQWIVRLLMRRFQQILAKLQNTAMVNIRDLMKSPTGLRNLTPPTQITGLEAFKLVAGKKHGIITSFHHGCVMHFGIEECCVRGSERTVRLVCLDSQITSSFT